MTHTFIYLHPSQAAHPKQTCCRIAEQHNATKSNRMLLDMLVAFLESEEAASLTPPLKANYVSLYQQMITLLEAAHVMKDKKNAKAESLPLTEIPGEEYIGYHNWQVE